MSDLLIKNGFIATMDGRGTVYRQGSLYVKNDRIEQIGETIDCPSNPDCVIDAEHRVVLPGFVNAHSHLQQYFRGVYESIGEFYRVNLVIVAPSNKRGVRDMARLNNVCEFSGKVFPKAARFLMKQGAALLGYRRYSYDSVIRHL